MAKADDKILREARNRFKEASEYDEENREASKIDHNFENGDQWDEMTIQDREGRPSLTINKISGVVKQIIGDQRQNSPSIKVTPVDNGDDVATAEIFTGIIRNIEQTSDADSAYDTGFFHQVVGGYGAWRVNTEYAREDTFDQDIVINRIKNPDCVLFDPMCQKIDKSDARYCFVFEDVDRDDFEAEYPKAKMDGFEDTGDNNEVWLDENTVKVAEYFRKTQYKKMLYQLADGKVIDGEEYANAIFDTEELPEGMEEALQGKGVEVEGKFLLTPKDEILPIVNEREAECDKITWYKMTGTEILDKQEWLGKYIPVVYVPGEETFVNGKTVLRSAIRHARDSQRIYNWMSSTSVETIAQAPKIPWMVTAAQIEGNEQEWNEAASRPKPYLIYNGDPLSSGPPQRMGGSTPDIGALQEAQKAADDIKATTGIYDASLGARGNEVSGKAIIARQREGDTSTYVFVDNLSRAIRYTGKILIDLIPKIYDAERVVRTLGPDGAEKFVTVNQVVRDPSSPNGQKIVNDLTVGKYDVIANVGPSYQTQRVEAAESMLSFIQAMPAAGQVMMDLVAKNLDWPGADEIEERLKKVLPPNLIDKDPSEMSPEELQQYQKAQQQAEQQAQQAQQMQQMQMQLMAAQLEKLQSDAAKTAAQAQQIGFEAEVDKVGTYKTMAETEGQQLENDKLELEIAGLRRELQGRDKAVAAETIQRLRENMRRQTR